MRRRTLHVLFAVLATLQVVQLARRGADELPRQERWVDAIAGRAVPDAAHALETWQGLAYHDVRAVLPALPEDAAVLVLTRNVTPVRYEYLLFPREVDLLIELEAEVVDALARRYPAQEAVLRARFRLLEERGLRATPERLLERLARADRVLVFDEAPRLPPGAPDLELEAEAGLVRVYRVVRGGGGG